MRWRLSGAFDDVEPAYATAPANLVAVTFTSPTTVVGLLAPDDSGVPAPVRPVAVNARTGRPRAYGPALGSDDSFPGSARAGRTLLITADDDLYDGFYGIDPTSLRVRWKRRLDLELDDPPVGTAGSVLVDGFEALTLDPRDGRTRRLALGRWFLPDRLVVGGGTVAAWDPSTGLLLGLSADRLPRP